MAHSRKASPQATRGVSALRFVVVCLALLTFSLQSYVTQTHIHIAPDRFASASDTKKLPDRFPSNGDPAKCPLCQEALHVGQFVTPSSAALLAPQLSASVIPTAVEPRVPAQRASHGWRSRAPPAA